MALDEQPNDNQKNVPGHGNRFLDTQKQVSPTSTYFDDASLNSKTLLDSQGAMPPTSAPTTPTECHRVPTSMTSETDLVSLTSSSMNGTVFGGSAGTTSEYPDVSSSPNNENDEKLAAFRNCSSSETPNSATTFGETIEMDTEAASTEGAMSQCKAVPTSSAISPNQNMKEASVLSTCHKNRSALSLFLFALVLDVLSEEIGDEELWDLLYANDLVITAENEEARPTKKGWRVAEVFREGWLKGECQ
ncbi:uncharacterized protein LOC135218683 [Macrobrachium nipponense]|uniref:uncharacterized protein LOC135218683 n=1 Tax=Macrobrachium nipponense TaxID=159736 RepID=UPI0030C8650E